MSGAGACLSVCSPPPPVLLLPLLVSLPFFRLAAFNEGETRIRRAATSIVDQGEPPVSPRGLWLCAEWRATSSKLRKTRPRARLPCFCSQCQQTQPNSSRGISRTPVFRVGGTCAHVGATSLKTQGQDCAGLL